MVLEIVNSLIENGYIDKVREYEQCGDIWFFYGYKYNFKNEPTHIYIKYKGNTLEAYSIYE